MQTRSFLYIEECAEGVRRQMTSDCTPVNIGSDNLVPINRLAELIMVIADKKRSIRHVPGPLGVGGRNSDNRLIGECLGWRPSLPLRTGMEIACCWIERQVAAVGGCRTQLRTAPSA